MSHPLGRIVEHDPRSRAFRAVAAPGPVVDVEHRFGGRVLDQGDVGSCTGNAIAGAMNSSPFHRRWTRYKRERDAVAAYSLATRLDGYPGDYPPDDTGSSSLAVCKAAVQLGWINGYRWAFGLSEMLTALVSTPVIVGTNWYEGMFHPSPSGLVAISGGVAGGHEYLAIGVDAEGRKIHFVNSWGRGWGYYGRFRMTFDTVDRLLAEQGDVAVPVR